MIEAQAFQDLGDKLTTSLVTGDFALYAGIMALPLTITPRGGTEYVLADLEALREDFDLYHRTIQGHGVTDIYREVQSVDRIPPDGALVRCRTHILVRALRLTAPFDTHLRLQRHGAGWRIAAIESSENHITWALGRGSLSGAPSMNGGGHAQT